MDADGCCAICHCELASASVSPLGALPCQHSFCYGCISKWATMRAVCPLCGATFSTLNRVDGDSETSEDIAEPAPQPHDQSTNLDCLDWQFFLVEISRLRAHVGTCLQSQARSCNKSGEDRRYTLLQQVVKRCQIMESQFEALARFDAENVMNELYDLQERVKLINRSNAEDLFAIAELDGLEEPRRFGADDYDDYDDDYDDYDEDEQYRTAASKSSAKKKKKAAVTVNAASTSAKH